MFVHSRIHSCILNKSWHIDEHPQYKAYDVYNHKDGYNQIFKLVNAVTAHSENNSASRVHFDFVAEAISFLE